MSAQFAFIIACVEVPERSIRSYWPLEGCLILCKSFVARIMSTVLGDWCSNEALRILQLATRHPTIIRETDGGMRSKLLDAERPLVLAIT